MSPTPLPASGRPPLQPNIFWIIWLVLTSGVIVYQFTLGHGLPSGANAPGAALPPIVWVAVAEIVVATWIRWVLLPRARLLPPMLMLMIIGLALSEAVEFYSLFLVPATQPETKLALWLASLLSLLQFAPIYANRAAAARR